MFLTVCRPLLSLTRSIIGEASVTIGCTPKMHFPAKKTLMTETERLSTLIDKTFVSVNRLFKEE